MKIKFIPSLRKITKKFNERGFSTNKNFMLNEGLFLLELCQIILTLEEKR